MKHGSLGVEINMFDFMPFLMICVWVREVTLWPSNDPVGIRWIDKFKVWSVSERCVWGLCFHWCQSLSSICVCVFITPLTLPVQIIDRLFVDQHVVSSLFIVTNTQANLSSSSLHFIKALFFYEAFLLTQMFAVVMTTEFRKCTKS